MWWLIGEFLVDLFIVWPCSSSHSPSKDDPQVRREYEIWIQERRAARDKVAPVENP